MTIYHWLFAALWLILIAIWASFAVRAKPNVAGGWSWRREIAVRVAILILVLLALRLPAFRHALESLRLHAVNRSPIAGFVGVVLCALGVALAILARVHLGRNWGLPMSRKDQPEFVATGPYAIIRHPIYAGLILAMLGSAIGQSIFWTAPLVLGAAYFIYSARREEKIMTEQFPDRYPAYMKRTRMLLPYVL